MARPPSKEAQRNLRLLKKLDPIKIVREWCENYKKEAGENWKPSLPADWFWEKKGLVIEYEVSPEVGESDLVLGLGPLDETFATEEGWRFETRMKAELERVKAELKTQEEKEQREVFESVLAGLLDRVREDGQIAITQHDVKLYLFEKGIDLQKGNIGMLTLAVNRKLGAKKSRREVVPTELRQEILRRANGKCENCGERTKYLQLDHKVPVSRGGTNDPDNLQALCPSCNAKKGNR